ncbi:hypothetical protein FSS13T_19070 [Flavobacterium saliperosum S13]|uniref:Thiol-disulfide isomerase or thioredoxin n=2 Tax=Flavobacterium saliperosum TaxID=329186 RepID=A0A1G4W833_9FLAO|nr:TlpA disulfide reductase family protein [Flavobacterium saliperosum]ESU24677.1 hypothetical protein FSS13T_19070 [Flavobacterium saliperosum S13]SCX18317.1 Thiol-disulfide isomerase or thioredoxin [Flavobacterium saliperosum]
MYRCFMSILICFLITVSCQKSNNTDYDAIGGRLENSYQDWWLYYNDSIKLSSKFKPLDADLKDISKEVFLKSLCTGEYIPLSCSSDKRNSAYRLYKLKANADENISSTIKNVAQIELANFLKEGQEMKPFRFVDLNGNLYTSENTKGKNVVLKCWFIHCKKCVEEMPLLNKMVAQYKNREDVVFISLASDSQSDLKQFLSKKDFEYAVIPNQDEFMKKTLETQLFPTHYVINKKGIITKVANDAETIREALQNEM